MTIHVENTPPRENERRGDREVINTIVGGFAGGDSDRKKHLRAVHQVNTVSFRPRMPPITFIDNNFKGVDYRQGDPMVISVDINKFTIMKTFVDLGSSVDILMEEGQAHLTMEAKTRV